jgi:formyltetrahydrofolate dehydrogenase
MPPNENVACNKSLRIALFGQSQFASDVFQRLIDSDHTIVGVFTILDKGSREDVLAKTAKENNIPVFKIKAYRLKGQLIPEAFETYKQVQADLNVLAFCTQWIPIEIVDYPRFGSICYHPSILPKHRGASAINWTLITGDKQAGFTIFWVDDGLDTGPILLQEKCEVEENDNVDSLYTRFLYPNGVNALVQAVDMIADGTAPRIVQSENGASYDAMLNKAELQKIDFNSDARTLHNFIRGMDSVPGALCRIRLPNSPDYIEVRLFGSSMWRKAVPAEVEIVEIENGNPALVHADGMLLRGVDSNYVNIKKIKVGSRMKLASEITKVQEIIKIDFTADDLKSIERIKNVWASILSMDVDQDTDFFACGAGSMDVVRLVEEVKEILALDELENEIVFMNPTFEDFCTAVISAQRGSSEVKEIEYRAVEMDTNGRKIRFPCQLFIDGKFIDATGGKVLKCINPSNEELICDVQSAAVEDVNKAVAAAKKAFEDGEWSKISARERGMLLYKLADLMQQHKEELATIESIDSGAVYTLALKTHVGMSIETWRYYAGWCDKIQGSTIPISHARPNRNFSFTRKEPIGVCGLVTPWNYPLMMLSWKMAACLAAGNTVIIKPAQVCPLTALKFAELAAKAGIPPGVINVLPGTGSVAGNAIANHPDVRKLGFTGSTEIGKTIMASCASSNLKKVSLELGGKSPLVFQRLRSRKSSENWYAKCLL